MPNEAAQLDDATVRALVDVYQYPRPDHGVYLAGSQGRESVSAEQVAALATEVLTRRGRTCGACRHMAPSLFGPDKWRCERWGAICDSCWGPEITPTFGCADWAAKEER